MLLNDTINIFLIISNITSYYIIYVWDIQTFMDIQNIIITNMIKTNRKKVLSLFNPVFFFHILCAKSFEILPKLFLFRVFCFEFYVSVALTN